VTARDRQLSTDEVAERLGISANTVRRLLADGEIRAVANVGRKATKRLRFSEEAIAAFIERRTYRPPRRGRTHLGEAS
jgi:excisionase family DNA binding protein